MKNGYNNRRRGIDAFSLKLLAAMTMLVDHLTVCFLEMVPKASTGIRLALYSDGWYLLDRIGRGIGRTAFPVFAFCFVEGFFHTKSRGRYLGRLLCAAAVSQLPFYLLNNRGPFAGDVVSGNTIATLSLGLMLIWAVDLIWGKVRFRQQGIAGLLRILAILACTGGAWLLAEKLSLDYGGAGVLTVLILYLLRGFPPMGVWRAAPLAAGIFLGSWEESEWFALPACVLLCFYNGERGRSGKWGKYFFYLFYPAHLLVLWGIRKVLFGY